jgi:SAM-dependent MidA family methyltransferase
MLQGAFLNSLGLRERAARLGASADETTRRSLHEAAERLTAREQMGTSFKVLAVTRQSISPPPFPPVGV